MHPITLYDVAAREQQHVREHVRVRAIRRPRRATVPAVVTHVATRAARPRPARTEAVASGASTQRSTADVRSAAGPLLAA